MGQIEFIDTDAGLAEAVGLLSYERPVAVDMESNGFFRYHERICLVQFAAGDTAFVVDPLAIDDLRPLGVLLANGSLEKLFHAAGNDVRSLHRDWGFRVDNLFDTSIAAAFVGSTQLGMQAVLKEHAGVELAKSRNLQRSDWTLRPLRPEALIYAADDVLHLSRVREVLNEKLRELSRLEWVMEECVRLQDARYAPPDREMAFFSIKGSRELSERGLAILRSLCHFRDQEARRLDRPVFKVVPDAALVQLSADPTCELSNIKGLGRFARPPSSRALKDAIDSGLKSEPVKRPERVMTEDPLGPEERKRVEVRLRSLKEWRNQVGEDLGLNPGLLWPAASLERLARYPESLEAELASAEVRKWQQREFSASLQKVVATLG